MNPRHYGKLVGWFILTFFCTVLVLTVLTFGDCFNEEVCQQVKQRDGLLVVGAGLAGYCILAVALVRKWKRNVL